MAQAAISEDTRARVHAQITSPIPQNLRLSPHEAWVADAMHASAAAASNLQISSSQLAYPGPECDSAARRCAQALRTDVDMDKLLSRGNGVHDKVPPKRAATATHMQGAPARLGTMVPIWDTAALERNLARHPNRPAVEYIIHELTHGVDMQVVLGPGVTFDDISHVVGADPDPIPSQRHDQIF